MKKFIGNIDHTLPEEVVADLKEKDNETKTAQWAIFEKSITKNAKEITNALKSMYEIYDDRLIKWMANLFDPDICICNEVYGKSICEHHPLCGSAGFHYTHSARDNIGYAPVVEALNSVFDFLSTCGITDYDHITEYFGKEYGDKMMKFVFNLQDPDGYFYHPQWGKDIGIGRRGRDYNRSLIMLERYGIKPKYPTIADLKGNSANNNTLIPDNMKTLDAFKKYLASQDIDNRSYHVGSVLGEQITQLKARGNEYIEELYQYFNLHQRPDNGIWSEKCDYYAVNGVMKIVYGYTSMEKPVPYPEKVFRASLQAIMSNEAPTTVVTVWNPWIAIKKLFENASVFYSKELVEKLRSELLDIAHEAILKTKEKILLFKKPDGSFSYYTDFATDTMQGSPCGIPNTVEGDMDAAVLGTNWLVRDIATVLGVSDNKIVPLYGKFEAAMFKNIIDNRKPVRKGNF